MAPKNLFLLLIFSLQGTNLEYFISLFTELNTSWLNTVISWPVCRHLSSKMQVGAKYRVERSQHFLLQYDVAG